MREFSSLKRILSYTRRAVQDYNMIEEGDCIAVGISGGKDSMTLACTLKSLQRFYPKRFDVKAITLDVGFPGSTIDHIKKLCDEIELELIVVPTEIYQVVFEIRKEKNPCSLCAKMRRGALHSAAKAAGCNKVALGHHFDDAVETLLLNLFNEGRLGCFSPVTYLDRSDITLIRPFIYVPEKQLVRFVNKENIIIPPKACKADGFTDRAKMKNMLAQMEKETPGVKARLFGVMERANLSGFHESPGKPISDICDCD